MIEAAYRYVRHEPGVDVVLFGTGNAEHLRANVAAIIMPPLPEADRAKLGRCSGTWRRASGLTGRGGIRRGSGFGVSIRELDRRHPEARA